MEALVQNGTATNVGPRAVQQRQSLNATDLPFVSMQASPNQDAVIGSRTFATAIIGRGGLLREGLARILSAGGFKVAGSASRVSELVQCSSEPDAPLLLIIDAGEDLEAALKEIELVKQEHPTARVAVLAGSDLNRDLVSLLRAGAHACFARKTTPEVFLKSLELVMLGESLLPQAALPFVLGREDEAGRGTRRRLDDEPPADNVTGVHSNGIPAGPKRRGAPHLSAQEKRVLCYLIEGCSNKVIARKLEIAEATTKVHVKAIIRKIGVTNRTQAAMWAMHNPPLEWGEGNGYTGSPAFIPAEERGRCGDRNGKAYPRWVPG